MNRLLGCIGSAVLVLAALPLVAEPSVAQPPPCTIVGTAGDDELYGTPGPDVICGLGGDDTLWGGDGRDVLYGGDGDDVLEGGHRDDRLYGGWGDDKLTDYRGRTVMRGGPGDDVLVGNRLRDLLFGGDGDDDLDGGSSGRDRLDGGAGTNFCTLGHQAVLVSCVEDTADPVVSSFTASSTSTDVTTSDGGVALRVHLTDDTGVTNARVVFERTSGTDQGNGYNGFLSLVEGSIRDGWWEGHYYVLPHADPGTGEFAIRTDQRSAGPVTLRTGTAFEVVNTNPDLEPVTADLLVPAPGATITLPTEENRGIRFKVDLADDASGIDSAAVIVRRLVDGEWEFVSYTHLTDSFEPTPNGIYEVIAYAIDGFLPGKYNVAVDTWDKRDHYASYKGPELYAEAEASDAVFPLPRGAGRFTVTRP